MNINVRDSMVFRNLCVLVLQTKVAFALEGQGPTLTFAATCPVGQVRFNFHLPHKNLHLRLNSLMFYNVSFKTK